MHAKYRDGGSYYLSFHIRSFIPEPYHYINGRKVGEVIMPHTLPRRISHEGLDALTQVGHGYEGEFPFSWTIENVVFELEDDRKKMSQKQT